MLLKFLLTVGLVLAVWYGFKFFSRLQIVSRDKVSSKVEKSDAETASFGIENMVKCPDCGAYVPDDSNHEC